MKTKLLNFLMPLVAMMLAIGGAFALDTAEKAKEVFTPITGYVNTNIPCSEPTECDTDGTVICTDLLGNIAYGKDDQERCNVQLTMLIPK